MEIAVGVAAVFAGACVQGCLGFGFGMVVVPVLLMYYPATTVIPLAVTMGMVISLPLGIHAREHFQASAAISATTANLIPGCANWLFCRSAI